MPELGTKVASEPSNLNAVFGFPWFRSDPGLPCVNLPLHVIVTVNAAWNVWNFRRPLIEALLADGHRVTIVAPHDDAVTNLLSIGCRFVPLSIDVKGLNPVEDIRLLLNMRDIFCTEKPHVIFSYTIKNNIFGAFAAKSLGIHFVPNVTGLGTAFLSASFLQRLVEYLYRGAFRHLPKVFFQNDDDRDLFLSRRLVNAGQAAVLPGSGIDLEHFMPFPLPDRGPIIFLMIARLLRDKGVFEFVEAAQKVREIYPQVRFQLLGPADAANRTAISLETVHAWEATHGIEYLTTSTDVRNEIAKAHCVVLPSYREGAPRTLIEAAAMGRPVIASNVPGCRTVVEHGLTGFLCKPRDSQSLADSFLEYLSLTREAQQAMGAAGRLKMERDFCQSIVVQSYRQAILSIAKYK